MNNELQVFNYNGAEVRTTEHDGEIWFVAKDVCDILGLRNARKAVKPLDDDEKGVTKSYTLGGMQDITIISESGLYALVFRSNKPEAKEFSRWVRHEVLPQIRKTGMYMTDSTLETMKRDPQLFDQLMKRYADEREKNRQLQEQIDRDRPLTNLGAIVLSQKGAIMFQSAAQFLSQHGIPTGQNRLFKYCRNKKLMKFEIDV